jgi:hypothetical protein
MLTERGENKAVLIHILVAKLVRGKINEPFSTRTIEHNRDVPFPREAIVVERMQLGVPRILDGTF